MTGHGSELPAWQRHAADLKLAGRITFTGFRTDISRVIGASDVMVHPAQIRSVWPWRPRSDLPRRPGNRQRRRRHRRALSAISSGSPDRRCRRRTRHCRPAASLAIERAFGRRTHPSPGRASAQSLVDRHGRGDRAGGDRVIATRVPAFEARTTCDVCGGAELTAVHELIFELTIYSTQDPELAAYSGPDARSSALRRVRIRSARGASGPAAVLRSAVRPALVRRMDRIGVRGGLQGRHLQRDSAGAGTAAGSVATEAPGRRRPRRTVHFARPQRGLGRRGARAQSPDRRVCRTADTCDRPAVERARGR